MSHSKELSDYRYEQAMECLRMADVMLGVGGYSGVANRSYYAIFHAMRSVMALDKVDFKRHGQVIGYFRREYIKTQIFPKEMSKIIDSLFMIRNESDYDDFFITSKEDVTTQLQSAKHFVSEIRKYLNSLPKEND